MRHRSFAEQHPILLGLGILFGVAFVITYWPVFVAAGGAYGAFLAARASAVLRNICFTRLLARTSTRD